MNLLFRDAEVDGSVADVRVVDGVIRDLAPGLARQGAEVVEAAGGALLPGLHDHHLHLLALAAAQASVDCSTAAGLAALASAPGTGWVRGTGYHESVAGDLDRHRLDVIVPHRPVRVQHRGGALWMLNSRAIELLVRLDESPDVERDASGEPTGRLWRYDEHLRAALTSEGLPDLGPVMDELVSLGITGVTDATPGLDPPAVEHLAVATEHRVRLTILGATGALPTGVAHGPFKLLLPDHDLPSYTALCDLVSAQHATGRPVAVHCVTRESLLLTLTALRDVGSLSGDRIEHASVVPPGMAKDLAALGIAVVTQPSFIRLRGDDYLRDVDPEDVPCLYPYASLVQAGVGVAASSDAPYGDLDLWRTMADAAHRRTRAGATLSERERVTTHAALVGYLTPPLDPGGRPRTVSPGQPADLCLLHVPLEEAMRRPSREHVRATVFGGEFLTDPHVS